MCGIAGIWSLGERVEEAHLRRMGDNMRSRGPDHQGVFIDGGANFGMVHQRLSIIDLDERANQPMRSPDGRFHIAFNGEIYNFQSLKQDLLARGRQFLTTSDTEVLLMLYQEHGAACLKLLNGMFAFAVFDTHLKELFVARDRLGEKPLYIYRSPNCLAFASDLKAFRQNPHIRLALDQKHLTDILLFDYVPQPGAVYANCEKLLPGHYMRAKSLRELQFEQYWDIPLGATACGNSTGDVVAEFREQFRKSVSSRLVSDVKVGAFLSGGLDSSAVVSQMQGDFTAFTIDFEGSSNTLDRQRSTELAQACGLRHVVTRVGQKSLEDFASLVRELDEPMSDQSILGLHYNFIQAKEHGVRVILTGDGADEVLGGYAYFSELAFIDRHWRYLRAGAPLLRVIEALLSPLTSTTKAGKVRDLYIRHYADLLGMQSGADRHLHTLSTRSSAALRRFMPSLQNTLDDPLYCTGYKHAPDGLDRLLYCESKTALVNRMLAKVDKTSMAHSVEARVPFLDHELVEMAFRLPSEMRSNKRILRLAMRGVLPEAILSDRKRGFNLPVRNWVRDFILRDVTAYVDVGIIARNLPVTSREVEAAIAGAARSNADMSKLIWSLFVLSHWLDANGF